MSVWLSAAVLSVSAAAASNCQIVCGLFILFTVFILSLSLNTLTDVETKHSVV